MPKKVVTKFPIQPGELYVFRYKSELAKRNAIRVYDQLPIALIIDDKVILRNGKVRKDLAIGINLHWIDRKYRQKFLDILQKQYYPKIKPNMRTKLKLKLYQQVIKQDKKLYKMAMKAVRMYYYKNITQFRPVPREMWGVVLRIKQYRSRFAYRARNYKH